MTIETMLSFPKGGSEYPPNTNLTSPPVISSQSGNEKVSTKRKAEESGSQNKSKKKKVVKSKKTEQRKFSADAISTANSDMESSNVTSEVICDTSASLVKKTKRIDENGSESSAKSSFSGVVDQKKSAKVKCNCDASKEEIKARKSMRLRLRRGRGESGFEPVTLNEADLRQFENLPSGFEFNEENKILFLGALELCHSSSISPTDKKTGQKVECNCAANATNGKQKMLPNQDVIKRSLPLEKFDKTKALSTSRSRSPIITIKSYNGPSIIGNDTKNLKVESNDTPFSNSTRDNVGWNRWVDVLSESPWAQKEPVESPPSQAEIDEHLKRLMSFGTQVKIMAPNIRISRNRPRI